ncbi:hypothetical protein Tco_0641552 [Tanacetum coccineum]
MTTPSNNSQMHNDIMAAGSRERPPMLAPGHYAQWSSRFMRYVDTKSNKNELRNCIEQAPYILTEIVHEAVPAIAEHPTQPCRIEQQNYANITSKSRKLIDVEAKAIHMILNGIGDNIYFIVDACSTAREIDGESIESYYSRFYKMMNKMVRNKLKVYTMQVNVRFLQQLQPEWSRFITIVKQQQDLDTVSYHRLFDIMKQHQNEVNEIYAEKIAKNANPLALVAAAQHYPNKYSPGPYNQAPKPYKTHTSSSRHTTTTSSHAPTKNKSKEIAKPITPLFESPSEDDSDPEQAQRDTDMLKNLALIAKKPKRAKDYAYYKEKMMLCKQEEKGVPLSAKEGGWLNDTDDELDEQELEAHYMYMAKI